MNDTSTAQARLRVQRVQAAYRQVADQLRGQILDGSLEPGARLPSEAELSRLFGVSRSTTREALRLLASQHLVDTVRGVTGGTFVSSPDAAVVAENLGGALGLLVNTQNMTVANLLQARLVLEPAAARIAAERADPQALEMLRATIGSTAAMPVSEGFEVHWDFHATLVAATGNPLLQMMSRPINEVLHRRLHRERVPAAEWERIDADHEEICRAVVAGDGDAAERLTRAHLYSLRPLYEQMDPEEGDVHSPDAIARVGD